MRRALAAAGLALVLVGCASGERVAPAERSERTDARSEARAGAVAEPGVSLLSAVLSADPWTYEGARGQVVRTRHYRIFTTETDALLAGRLPGFLELALEHYRTAITPLPAPDLRLDAYLMDNRPQWARLTQRLLGERAAPFLRIQRGGFATRGIGVYYDLGAFDTLAIAAHEGWHQYTQRTFRNGLPTWLEEGVASYMEGHRWAGSTPVFLPWANLERYDQLRAAAAGVRRLPPLSAFVGSLGAVGQAEEAGLDFYAQAWLVTHFLASERREGLARLLGDAAEGRLQRIVGAAARERASITGAGEMQRVLFETYFGDFEEAEAEYERFLAAVVAPGGRGDIAAGRPPAALSR